MLRGADLLSCLQLLRLGFLLGSDCADLDFEELALELVIEVEGVGLFHLTAHRLFPQHIFAL